MISILNEREDEASFTTFCHISQFGTLGYRALPRMVAMSTPCLWAPSSVVLKSGESGISAATFLRYLESGKLRVLGRYEWLQDPRWRDTQRWPGTEWDEYIDGAIKAICNEDASKPLSDQRVVIAPPEGGWGWAATYLEANPGEIARWQQVLKSENKRKAIPLGTREAAMRDLDDPFKSAQRILRDAYNHGQAIVFSGADTPFLLQRTHREFLRILARAPASPGLPLVGAGPVPQQAPPETLRLATADLAAQLLQILDELDVHARSRGRKDSLDDFISGEGRQDLMRWMSRIFLFVKETDARNVSNLLVGQLKSDLSQGRFESFLKGFKNRPGEESLAIVGVISAVLSLLPTPGNPETIAGVGAALYPVGKGLARQMGWASSRFNGPDWPFLYAYGTRPKRRQQSELQYVLEHMQQERDFS